MRRTPAQDPSTDLLRLHALREDAHGGHVELAAGGVQAEEEALLVLQLRKALPELGEAVRPRMLNTRGVSSFK